jgi:hypothetical protein
MNTNETTKDKRLESHKNLIQYQVLRNGSISSSLFERIMCVKLNNVFYFIIESISSSSCFTRYSISYLCCFIMTSIFCFTPEGIFRLNWAASPDSLWTYPHTIHHALLKLHQLIWYWYIIHKIVYNSPLSYIC